MIDINNESGVTADELGLVSLARFALEQLRIHPQADLSILLVDETTLADYHERFMDLPGPTDVMSFPMDELREPADDRTRLVYRVEWRTDISCEQLNISD